MRLFSVLMLNFREHKVEYDVVLLLNFIGFKMDQKVIFIPNFSEVVRDCLADLILENLKWILFYFMNFSKFRMSYI